jgi:hypothetical protein
VEQAIEFSRKSQAGNPRLYYTHTNLAAAFALNGDLNQARAALAEGIKLQPGIRSLAQVRASFPYANPKYVTLVEKTVFVGLRLAGMPEE